MADLCSWYWELYLIFLKVIHSTYYICYTVAVYNKVNFQNENHPVIKLECKQVSPSGGTNNMTGPEHVHAHARMHARGKQGEDCRRGRERGRRGGFGHYPQKEGLGRQTNE